MDRTRTMSEGIDIEGNGDGNEPVLIAGKPSRMRDSLHTLLKTMPGIEIVGHADDDSAALRMVAEHRPVLVLLDTNLPGEDFTTVLDQIKAARPKNRSLVLVENLNQQQEARAAGADAALIKGYRTAELFAVIERLLSWPGSPN